MSHTLTLKEEVQFLDELLASKEEEFKELRRGKTESLTFRVVDNVHKWYVVVAEKDLVHEY